MDELMKAAIKEIIRVIAAAILAVLGIEATGCVASGNNSAACFSVSGK